MKETTPLYSQQSFFFSHVRLRPEEQIGLHSQSTWELSCIVRGEGRRRLGEEWGAFESGEVMLVPPRMPHCWVFDDHASDARSCIENMTIMFSAELLSRLSYSFPELREVEEHMSEVNGALRFRGDEAVVLRELMRQMVGRAPMERIPVFIDILIFLSSHVSCAEKEALLDLSTEQERRVREVETYVSCNFQRDIDIDTVSRHVGMNRSAFCTFFRKATGSTFVNYLNSYRINAACDMLLSTKATVAEVCYASGFHDVPYFNRVFKRLKGVSPKMFRGVSDDSSSF